MAFLSGRSPSYRGWRSSPFWVHSAKAISATSLGSTQWTRLADRRLAVVEGVGLLAQLVEPLAEVEQHLAGISRADLARVAEPLALVIADQERPEPDARALRVGPAGDDELLPPDALDLHPGVAAARDVEAVQPLADDPFLGRLAGPASRPRSRGQARVGEADAVGPGRRPRGAAPGAARAGAGSRRSDRGRGRRRRRGRPGGVPSSGGSPRRRRGGTAAAARGSSSSRTRRGRPPRRR